MTLDPEVSAVRLAPGHVRVRRSSRIARFYSLIQPTRLFFYNMSVQTTLLLLSLSSSLLLLLLYEYQIGTDYISGKNVITAEKEPSRRLQMTDYNDFEIQRYRNEKTIGFIKTI